MVYGVAAGPLLLPLQAVKGFTINGIKTKLKRHGVVVDRRGDTAAAATAANGSPSFFDLSNVFDVEDNSSTFFKPPKYLSIADPAIDAAMGEGPGGEVAKRIRSIHVSVVLSMAGCGCPFG